METHILFFILAGVLIVILIGYSIWSARREKSRVFSNTFSTRPPSTPINEDLNLSSSPSLNSVGFSQNTPTLEMVQPVVDEQQVQQEVQDSVKNIKIRLSEQPENKPLYYVAPEVEAEPAPAIQYPSSSSLQVQQMPEVQQPAVQQEEPVSSETSAPQANIISLYVVAPEGMPFRGEAVVQNLEAVGFQFGEYQIFHRHLDNTASPVLFSVANMMQPGIFDLSKIDRFSTVGLVFFMHLPSAGNDLVNLRLMIRTVESFAQSVGGFILNDEQQLFDDASRQAYLLRATQS